MSTAQLPMDEVSPVLIASEREAGERVIAVMCELAARHQAPLAGFGWEQAQFSLVKDPLSGEISLTARWAGDGRGTLNMRPGGWVYGELDVCKPHPTNAGQFMEAVVAWGHVNKLKTEIRLLEMQA